MGSGGIGFTIGSKKENANEDNTQESAARSQVGSLSGNMWIKAKEHYQQTGSVVSSVKGDVDIDAKSVDIRAARSDYESNYRYEMKQKGFTIALTGAAVSAIQAVKSPANSAKAVGESKNNRINALAAANAGFDGLRAVEAGLALKDAIADAGLAQGVSSGVGVSITYGQQKSV
nr:hypothetical protein [uncultured Haemophilus sp.]